MFRITSSMLYNNNLYNVFKNTEGIFNAQEQLASGKRINRPSDDPGGTARTLTLKKDYVNNEQYMRNIADANAWMNIADASLTNMIDLLARARELAVGQASGSSTALTRRLTAEDIINHISGMIQLGNTKIGNQYIFSGKSTSVPPFTSGAVYMGSRDEAIVEIFDDNNIGVGLDGSRILATNFDPILETGTSLSTLNQGQGVSLGSILITDRAGNSATVNLSGASTVGDVLTAISGAGGVNVTAIINSTGNGIVLTDNNAVPVSNLSVSEVGGNTASSIGLLSNRPLGVINGLDLDPVITNSTPLSLLNKGMGLSLSSINVTNAGASGTVTLSTATTIGDVITQINAASVTQGLNVTASINSSGTSIQVVSNDPTTVAVVMEVGSGTSASDLGISGSSNAINTLLTLRDAMLNNDAIAIANSITLLDSASEGILSVLADVGARGNRLIITEDILTNLNYENLDIRSKIEDADMAKVASDLARFNTAYEATLKASAFIIQPSLLDYLR